MFVRLRRAGLAITGVTAAVLIVGTDTASAHVSVSSADAAPSGFGEMTFTVPTESDTASTVSLRVQLPADTPLAFVSVKPVPGWTAKETKKPISPPITDDDGNKVTEAVSEITWAAEKGAGIKPGEYQTFSLDVGPLPDAEQVTVPTIQGYDDGTEVSWIDPTVEGQPEPTHPAPVLTLAKADAASSSGDAATNARSGGGSSNGLAVVALVVAAIGALAALAALVVALGTRRRSSTT